VQPSAALRRPGLGTRADLRHAAVTILRAEASPLACEATRRHATAEAPPTRRAPYRREAHPSATPKGLRCRSAVLRRRAS